MQYYIYLFKMLTFCNICETQLQHGYNWEKTVKMVKGYHNTTPLISASLHTVDGTLPPALPLNVGT